MIHAKISVATLWAIVGVQGYGFGGVLGDEFDQFFGGNDALSETDSGDTENLFADPGARVTIIIDQPPKRTKPPKSTRAPKPPKPETVVPHTHTPPRTPPLTGTPTLTPTETPTDTPTMSPTETAITTDTPTMSPTGICSVPDRGSERRPSRCSRARNKAYEEALSLFQSRFYDCDCYQVGQFAVSATDELLEGKYKVDKKDNSFQESLKKCARDGVERYINDAAEACIGPGTCEEIGFLVTDLIITDFCAIPSNDRYNNDLLKECAKEARSVCKKDLFMALIDFLEGGYDCPAKDQFGDAAEARDFMNEELSKQCRDKVEEILFE